MKSWEERVKCIIWVLGPIMFSRTEGMEHEHGDWAFCGTIVTTSTRGIVWLGMWIHVVLGIPFQVSLRVLLSKGCIEPSFLAVRGVFTLYTPRRQQCGACGAGLLPNKLSWLSPADRHLKQKNLPQVISLNLSEAQVQQTVLPET